MTSDNRKREKCYVCLKKECWSSKHTKEEHDKSRNRFKERFGQQFNRKAAQYIANFEGIEFSLDNDLSDENLDEIQVLVIDIPSLPSTNFNDENFETFFTLLGFVEKAKEMAINFTNRLFSHSLITISNALPNHINSTNTACDMSDTNLFAYIATD